MDAINLPLLNADETIEEALRTLRQSDTRALLVRFGEGKYRMLKNTDLLEAAAKAHETLEQVRTGTAVPEISPALAVEEEYDEEYDATGASAVDLYITNSEIFESLLDHFDSDYGIIVAKEAILVTRHEWQASAILNSGIVCACRTNRNHQETSPPVTDGDPCIHGDGVYECY